MNRADFLKTISLGAFIPLENFEFVKLEKNIISKDWIYVENTSVHACARMTEEFWKLYFESRLRDAQYIVISKTPPKIFEENFHLASEKHQNAELLMIDSDINWTKCSEDCIIIGIDENKENWKSGT